MVDFLTKKKRSELMARVRRKNTAPEVSLRKLVSAHFYPLGLRYRVHTRNLPGTPDVVFVSRKVAIFVDGAFWHGYRFDRWRHKLDGRYWLPKIKDNMKRDRRVTRRLKAQGWTVLRIWDHEVKKHPEKVLCKIRAAVGISGT